MTKILVNSSHPSKVLRVYTLAINNERSGEVIQCQVAPQQPDTTR